MFRRLLRAAFQAADPARCLQQHVKRRGSVLQVGTQRYDLRSFRRIVAVGAGKASARLAAALEACLGSWLEGGLVVVKYGHVETTTRIEIAEAGHPVPDTAGARAVDRLLRFVNSLTEDDLLLVLLSGGASSLLPAPPEGISLMDTQQLTQVLLRCGATIGEVNAVRKHLSRLKGGQLVVTTPARVVSLILSDVLGDDMSAIASGPTVPDVTTFHDAMRILDRYDLSAQVPRTVLAHLAAGAQGERPETPKPGDPIFRRVENQVIGNNARAVKAVTEAAQHSGVRPVLLTTTLTGEAREAARFMAAIGREIVASGRPARRPACIVAGGELTVTVRGDGRGGRAQEFALAGAVELQGVRNVWMAGIGTDGSDGPTEAAGAVVSGETALEARARGIDLRTALERNDSYSALASLNRLVITGPTRTNVNDLYLLLAL